MLLLNVLDRDLRIGGDPQPCAGCIASKQLEHRCYLHAVPSREQVETVKHFTTAVDHFLGLERLPPGVNGHDA